MRSASEKLPAARPARSITAAMLNGIKRGLFSNEAGMGSAPNIAATATPVPHHPSSQGLVQAFAVFVDTIVICTATAVMILPSGVMEGGVEVTGAELTQLAKSRVEKQIWERSRQRLPQQAQGQQCQDNAEHALEGFIPHAVNQVQARPGPHQPTGDHGAHPAPLWAAKGPSRGTG